MVKASPSKDFARHIKCKNMNVMAEASLKGTAESPNHIRKLKEKNELRSLYRQLKDVIPSCKSKPVSSLDIVLRAVDYINELHSMLDEHSTNANDSAMEQSQFARQLKQAAADKARNASIHDITNVTTCTEIRATPRVG